MKGRLFVIVFALATIILLCLAYRRPPRDPDAVPSTSGAVAIQTANPYSFDVRLEVKCDWEGTQRRYRFYQVIVVPGKRQTLIRVPNDLRFCEIWPKVLW